MANKFSLGRLFDINKIIYVAPILLFASLFHIFSHVNATHNFGQIEVFAALIIVGYDLWNKIALIYPLQKMGKKRIEAVVCFVVSIFVAMIPFPFLMSWQYYNLYQESDRYTYSKQITLAVLSVWIGVGILFYSSYILLADRMAAKTATVPESSYVAPSAPQGQ